MDNKNFAISNTKITLGIKFHVNYLFFARRVIKNFTFTFPIEKMRGIRLCRERTPINSPLNPSISHESLRCDRFMSPYDLFISSRVPSQRARLNAKISCGDLAIPSRSRSSVGGGKTNENCGRTKVPDDDGCHRSGKTRSRPA